jgi:hypothetical protein
MTTIKELKEFVDGESHKCIEFIEIINEREGEGKELTMNDISLRNNLKIKLETLNEMNEKLQGLQPTHFAIDCEYLNEGENWVQFLPMTIDTDEESIDHEIKRLNRRRHFRNLEKIRLLELPE